jgi:hypothetical protein
MTPAGSGPINRGWLFCSYFLQLLEQCRPLPNLQGAWCLLRCRVHEGGMRHGTYCACHPLLLLESTGFPMLTRSAASSPACHPGLCLPMPAPWVAGCVQQLAALLAGSEGVQQPHYCT